MTDTDTDTGKTITTSFEDKITTALTDSLASYRWDVPDREQVRAIMPIEPAFPLSPEGAEDIAVRLIEEYRRQLHDRGLMMIRPDFRIEQRDVAVPHWLNWLKVALILEGDAVPYAE